MSLYTIIYVSNRSRIKGKWVTTVAEMGVFLLLIKPDAVERRLVGEILARFERRDFEIQAIRTLVPTRKLISEHYAARRDRAYYTELVHFMTSGMVVAVAMNGSVDIARQIAGSTTVPTEHVRGTIRGDYSCDVLRNLVHVSTSPSEMRLWFPGASTVEALTELMH